MISENKRWFLLTLLSIALSACGGGGGSSPTEPLPPARLVELEGNWSGSVDVTSPTATTCTLSLQLTRDEGDYFGSWRSRCPDGAEGSGIATAVVTFGPQVLLIGLRATTVFGGCGWSTTAVRTADRIEGDWGNADNCSTGPVMRGRLELRKQS